MKPFIWILTLITLSTGAWAAKNAIGLNDVGTDSCGLGWQITQKKSFLATTTRGTTNAFVPPSFGMTFGTIGCDKHSFVKNEQALQMYATVNHDNLALEMAQGEGEYLSAFAYLLGCQDTAALGQMTQRKYSDIIDEKDTPRDLYQNVKDQIIQDPALSQSCGTWG